MDTIERFNPVTNKLTKALADQTAHRTYVVAAPARAAEILGSFESASMAEHYVRTHNDTHPWTDGSSKARVIAARLNLIGGKSSSVARLLVVRGLVEREDITLFEFGPDAHHYLTQDSRDEITREMVEVPFFAHDQFIPAPAASDGHWSPMFFTADLVLFAEPGEQAFDSNARRVLLIRRSPTSEAFPGCWALPGGFVDPGEDSAAAALRELKEETDVDDLTAADLTFVKLADRPGRDPRGRIVSAVYTAPVFPHAPKALAGDDAVDVAWMPVTDALAGRAGELAFDHADLIRHTLMTMES